MRGARDADKYEDERSEAESGPRHENCVTSLDRTSPTTRSQPLAHRPGDQFGRIAQFELASDVFTMLAHRVLRDLQLVADLFARQPGSHGTSDF